MEPINQFSCSYCGKKLKVSPSLSGRTVACPACGGKLTVPRFDEAAPSVEPPALPVGTARRPRVLVLVIAAGGVCVLVGVLAIVIGRSRKSGETPAPIPSASAPSRISETRPAAPVPTAPREPQTLPTSSADVQDLIEKLKSENGGERRDALDKLAAMGPQAVTAVPAIAEALRQAEMPLLRIAGIDALKKLDPDNPAIAEALVAWLLETWETDKDYQARVDAVAALGATGHAAIANGLRTAEAGKRKRLLAAVYKQGALARPLLPDVIASLEGAGQPVCVSEVDRILPQLGTALPEAAKDLADRKSVV